MIRLRDEAYVDVQMKGVHFLVGHALIRHGRLPDSTI
jgi:hypothetical protein